MAQIRICDRCKKEINDNQEWFKIDLGGRVFTGTPTNTKKKTFDLCPDCYDAFIEFIFKPKDACIHFVDERKEI